MQKRLLRWELIGFAFTGAVGTLLHFVYEWTGGNPLIAAFCAVNESTWEHMKLLFVPFFLFTMVQFIVFAEPLRSFFAAKAASILLGVLAADLTPLRLPPQTASAVTQADIDKLKKENV